MILAVLILTAFPLSGEGIEMHLARSQTEVRPFVIYPKSTAEIIAQNRASYPQAKARFLSGLKKGTLFSIAVRGVDGLGKFHIMWIDVSGINPSTGDITGRVAETQLFSSGRSQDISIKIAEKEVIDWRITPFNGIREGGALQEYLSKLPTESDVDLALTDQRDLDESSLCESKAVGDVLDHTFQMLFDIQVERVGQPILMEWPSIEKRFRDVPHARLVDMLVARAKEIHATMKATVDAQEFLGRPLVIVTAYAAAQKHHVIYQIVQVLQLKYDKKDRLDQALWGARAAEDVKSETPPPRTPGQPETGTDKAVVPSNM